MKKEIIFLDDYILSDDYKLAHVEMEMIKTFESTERWLYLGADATNPNFARIGITMGDLRSRSYSSANPNYYLFCAFKCKPELSVADLKNMEDVILARFQNYYINYDGSTKRSFFYESGLLSDCFYKIDFLDFFVNLHSEIYQNYRSNFVTCGMEDEFGGEVGEFVDCIFNRKVENQNRYIRMIVQ
jgi:hypothetical protein